jgi:hypothetical protein
MVGLVVWGCWVVVVSRACLGCLVCGCVFLIGGIGRSTRTVVSGILWGARVARGVFIRVTESG